MENELEMIQTLFEYQNFGLAPFPIMPFSKEIHKGNKGKIFFDNAQSGIQMSEEEIYDWFGEKKLDNCGLICGEEGNLSVLEFESDTVIIRLMSLIEKESLDKISNLIFYNFLENLYSSTTFIRTPDKKIQFWFKFSKNLPSFLWNNNKSINTSNNSKDKDIENSSYETDDDEISESLSINSDIELNATFKKFPLQQP